VKRSDARRSDTRRSDARRFDTRYAVWGAALLLLVGIPLISGFAGLGWELAQLAGLASALACLALAGAPVRPRDSVPPTLLSLRTHTLIGWGALLGAVIHAGGLILADRSVLEYLKPTTPLYQWAGIVATCLLLLLVLGAGDVARRRLFASHRNFQATHVVLGCALTVLIAVHVVVTHRYVGGAGRRAWLLVVAIAALLLLLRARRRDETAGRDVAAGPHAPLRRRLVFGRHSHLVTGAVVVSAAAVALLYPHPVDGVLREPLLGAAAAGVRADGAPALPLDFPHGKHGMVNCLICHHNYADGLGWDDCVRCHRSARSDLKMGVEARFHGFCFECHRDPPAGLKHHGPVSGCAVCHRMPGTTP